MKIVVLLKEVPDTYGERHIDLETGLADRTNSDAVLDEICERAVEAALNIAENSDGVEVDVLCMGPQSAVSSIRKALAMGAEKAIHIVDEDLLGADTLLTAEMLAAAISRGEYDLIVAGNLSTDGNGGVVPAMVAELLDYPHLTQLTEVTVEGKTVSGVRSSDSATMNIEGELPAVISITETFPDARFPNFKGLKAAKSKPVETLSAEDLGVDPLDFSVPRSIMISANQRPPRETGEKITDDGTAAAKIAEFLASNGHI
ncbi:electron transfer flavoprotein subunit beta [Corynebacterium poyangense]|uniref:Electron transfer flavoprotein subunit beta n=1 Tax=Corynebacterium poyangense TaxID=2684405 RepID=A0A7H0SR96_9CORY|nr:electron transfer flavoprotein subunit beta/FixA family protein [Corynebacterium poyangense]QNQ91071.1 electron transfer flavoprotein subunit beta [Corynebacterium poyangense]